MRPMRILRTVFLLALLALTVSSQDIRIIGGGTRTHHDPEDWRFTQAVAENDTLRVTVGKSQAWKHQRAGVFGLYLKVENLSDSPIMIQTGSFTAIDARSGKRYAGLETEEVIKRYNETGGATMATSGGSLREGRFQEEVTEEVRRESLASGEVQPHSSKEGLIYFEAPDEPYYAMKVTLTGLWPEHFTIEKRQMPDPRHTKSDN